ncbi:hypothetical protein DPMN_034191 [Dreissena polymorpha]|uniref:Uncharacterized protein n=1 Tax=Dreissena polymorpha TaxID=45954 RepID=A0A9D4M509_DREPO|nr:hypothetical protein DPMN_034191 [Dreissena polymorpha]
MECGGDIRHIKALQLHDNIMILLLTKVVSIGTHCKDYLKLKVPQTAMYDVCIRVVWV